MSWMPRLPGRPSASDEVAMRKVQADGDPAAFAQLVDRWEGPIRRLCVRMTGDAHCGEDLTQETFARVFANRQRFDARRRFSTWLWRIALNLCHEDSRRLRRRGGGGGGGRGGGHTAADVADEPADVDEPHARVVRSEQAQLVRDALQQLPESHRAVVLLREYENLKFREIADVLDVPEGTVKWRMSEALDQLGGLLRPILSSDESRPARKTQAASPERLTL